MTKPRKINVEPLLFFHSFSFGLCSTIGTAFITFKYCLWLLDSDAQPLPNPHDYCLRLGSTPADGLNSTHSQLDVQYLNRVQAAAARFVIIQEAVSTVPTVLATIYIGSWSDRSGRKPPMVVALAGSAIASHVALIVSAIDSIPVHAMLAPALISAATGSILVVYSGAYSMISDSVRDSKYLTIRIGVASGMASIGSLLAELLAGFILQHWDNYTLMYLGNSVCTFMAFIYGTYGLQETIQFSRQNGMQAEARRIDPSTVSRAPIDDHCEEKALGNAVAVRSGCRSFLTAQFLKECLAVLTTSRVGRRRFYLLTTVVSFALLFIIEPRGVLNLFAKRPPLSMTNSEYSFVTAAGSALTFAPALTTWLFKTSDMCLIVTGLAFGVFKMAMTAFSTRKWMLFLAMGLGGLSHLHTTGFRSFTTKLVESTETGRLFAAVGAIAHLGPLLGSTIFNNLYAETLTWFPGFVFLFSAAFSLLILLIMGYIYIDITTRGNYANQGQLPPAGIQCGDDDRNLLIHSEINA